jgi:hypothetical protein
MRFLPLNITHFKKGCAHFVPKKKPRMERKRGRKTRLTTLPRSCQGGDQSIAAHGKQLADAQT